MSKSNNDIIAAAGRLIRARSRKWGAGWTLLSTDQQTAEACRAIVAVLVGMDDETCSHNPALGRLQRLAEAVLNKVGGEP